MSKIQCSQSANYLCEILNINDSLTFSSYVYSSNYTKRLEELRAMPSKNNGTDENTLLSSFSDNFHSVQTKSQPKLMKNN